MREVLRVIVPECRDAGGSGEPVAPVVRVLDRARFVPGGVCSRFVSVDVEMPDGSFWCWPVEVFREFFGDGGLLGDGFDSREEEEG